MGGELEVGGVSRSLGICAGSAQRVGVEGSRGGEVAGLAGGLRHLP